MIRKILPPIILELLKRLRAYFFDRTFDSFEEALIYTKLFGYENPLLVEFLYQKTINFRDKLHNENGFRFDTSFINTLIAFSGINYSNTIQVVDYGGSFGYHYFIMRKIFPKNIKIFWNVIETPSICNKAELLQTDELLFFKSIQDYNNSRSTEKVDLVLLSSSLQFLKNPLEVLGDLIDIDSKHIFITRTPFNKENRNIISVQTSKMQFNGPGKLNHSSSNMKIKYPIHFISREVVESYFNGYDLIYSVEEDAGGYFHKNANLIVMSYLYTKKIC